MYYTSSNAFGQPGGAMSFMVRRLIRIVPLYWLFTTLILLPGLLSPGTVRSADFDLPNIITSYLFLPYERSGGRIAPVLSVGWTLNYEMLFYVIFMVALLLPKRAGIAAIFLTLLGLTGLGFMLPQTAPAALRFWTGSIMLTFAMGILLALAYERFGKRFANVWLFLACFAAGELLLWSLVFGDAPRFVWGGIPAALIVGSAIMFLPSAAERAVPAWVMLLGGASYALYLCHRFVLRLGSIAVHKLHLGLIPFVLLILILSIIVSVAVFKLIEEPLTNRLKHLGRPKKPAQPVPAE